MRYVWTAVHIWIMGNSVTARIKKKRPVPKGKFGTGQAVGKPPKYLTKV